MPCAVMSSCCRGCVGPDGVFKRCGRRCIWRLYVRPLQATNMATGALGFADSKRSQGRRSC